MHRTVGEAARRAIAMAEREFLERARRGFKTGRTDDLHCARIAAKRLRYTLEFYASVLGPSNATSLGLLALLQDRLGAIADDGAFERFYAKLARRLESGDPRRYGIEERIAACDAHRREAIEAVIALWTGGEYPPYPEMLAASISASLRSLSSNAA